MRTALSFLEISCDDMLISPDLFLLRIVNLRSASGYDIVSKCEVIMIDCIMYVAYLDLA